MRILKNKLKEQRNEIIVTFALAPTSPPPPHYCPPPFRSEQSINQSINDKEICGGRRLSILLCCVEEFLIFYICNAK